MCVTFVSVPPLAGVHRCAYGWRASATISECPLCCRQVRLLIFEAVVFALLAELRMLVHYLNVPFPRVLKVTNRIFAFCIALHVWFYGAIVGIVLAWFVLASVLQARSRSPRRRELPPPPALRLLL